MPGSGGWHQSTEVTAGRSEGKQASRGVQARSLACGFPYACVHQKPGPKALPFPRLYRSKLHLVTSMTSTKTEGHCGSLGTVTYLGVMGV